jgi:hypothetical protein
MIWTALKSKIRLKKNKTDLIDFAFRTLGISSFADLGGIWGVEGGYTFHALNKFIITRAVLVDTHPTSFVEKKAKSYPQLQLIKGNFGDIDIINKIDKIDAVFLFDVLLHQVNPDWNKIIDQYATRTNCFIIYNQQWIGSQHTVRLLELGEEEYFKNVPHNRTKKPYNNLFRKLNEKHPDHDRNWKDVHHIWQWGITDEDIKQKFESLGFKLNYIKNYGQFGKLDNFENHSFIFTREF